MAEQTATSSPPITEAQFIEGKSTTYEWFMGAAKMGIGAVVALLVGMALFLL